MRKHSRLCAGTTSEVLEWAADLISERISGSERRSKRFRVPLRHKRPPADLDIPLIFAEELTRDRRQLGGPDRRAA